MLGEGNCTDVDLAETEPWKNDGEGDDALKPEGSVVLASVGELLSRLTVVVDEENDLNPDQSQRGPSEETVSQIEGIVEFGTHGRVGKHKHHQEQSQDDPGNNDSGK